MEAQQVVGWNVRRIRTGKGITIEDLAGQAEVDPSYLARIERGTANPSIGKIEALAKALSVTLIELLEDPPAGAKRPKPLPAGRRPRT